MNIEFGLDQVFCAESTSLEDAEVLRALLDCLITCDLAYLRHHKTPNLYESGVVYGRTKIWDRIPNVLAKRHADCKSLSAWRIAELIHQRTYGNYVPQPSFRWRTRPGTTIKDFHILVMLPGGKWECPSLILGMGKDENAPLLGGRMFR